MGWRQNIRLRSEKKFDKNKLGLLEMICILMKAGRLRVFHRLWKSSWDKKRRLGGKYLIFGRNE